SRRRSTGPTRRRSGARCASARAVAARTRTAVGSSAPADTRTTSSIVPREEGQNYRIQFSCRVCHAVHNAGHLEIEGHPERGLTWGPRAAGWKSGVEKEL